MGSTTDVLNSPELDNERLEQEIHGEINRERESRDLTPLKYDDELRDIARYHSDRMAEEEFFAHVAPDGETMEDRYRNAGYVCEVPINGHQFASGGENIAQNWYRTRTESPDGSAFYSDEEELAAAIVEQWMESSGHRENILRPFWRYEGIGVSVMESSEGTKVYATQNFC